MKKALLTGIIAAGLALAVAAPSARALDSADYSLFSDAAYSMPGNASDRAVTLTSGDAPGYGGIAYDTDEGMTFDEIGVLSTDYKFATGDSCGGGSPRFQIEVESGTTTKNIFAYLGSSPSYNDCDDDVWLNSGDLLADGKTVDTSQLPGGTFYDTYASATEKYGDLEVVDISLVADAGWAMSGSQIVAIDNTMVDSTLFTYEATTTPPAEDETAPTLPVHLSPAHNSTTTTAAFTMADWTDATDASSIPVTYRYESSYSPVTDSDGSFSSPIYTSGVLATSSILTAGTPEGTYYWHVMAVDAAGNETAWTDAWKIVVDNDSGTTTPPTGTSTPPTAKDQCENGGWMDFTNPTFRNQGQCIGYSNRNR